MLWTLITNTVTGEHDDAFTEYEIFQVDSHRFNKAINIIYGPKGKRPTILANRGPKPIDDREVIAKIRDLVEAGTPLYTAAKQVVDMAGGVGDDESKIRRLVKRYKEIRADQIFWEKADKIFEDFDDQYSRDPEKDEEMVVSALNAAGWPHVRKPPPELIP